MGKSNKNSEGIYYLGAKVRRSRRDPDSAGFDTTAEVWVKATNEDQARDISTQQLLSAGWCVTKIHILIKVTPGFARLASMLDPPVYSEEEADEWTEHYEVAEIDGYTCVFNHYQKNGRNKMQQKKKHTVKTNLQAFDL